MATAEITPRFKPPEVGFSVHAGGPQQMWARFGHAIMDLQRAARISGGVDDRVHSSSCQSSFIAAAPHHHVAAAANSLHRPSSPSDRPSLLPSSRPARPSFAQVVAGVHVRATMSAPSRPTVPPGATAPAPGATVSAPAAVRPGAPPVANAAPFLGPPGFQGWPAGAPMPSQLAPAPRPSSGFRPPARAPAPPMQYIPP
nr:uncharacterized protein LOC127335827 [Lolium perenne]